MSDYDTGVSENGQLEGVKEGLQEIDVVGGFCLFMSVLCAFFGKSIDQQVTMDALFCDVNSRPICHYEYDSGKPLHASTFRNE